MCNDALYLTVYEAAAIHSQGAQNPEVHDVIMHASRVPVRGREVALRMARVKRLTVQFNIREFHVVTPVQTS